MQQHFVLGVSCLSRVSYRSLCCVWRSRCVSLACSLLSLQRQTGVFAVLPLFLSLQSSLACGGRAAVSVCSFTCDALLFVLLVDVFGCLLAAWFSCGVPTRVSLSSTCSALKKDGAWVMQADTKLTAQARRVAWEGTCLNDVFGCGFG